MLGGMVTPSRTRSRLSSVPLARRSHRPHAPNLAAAPTDGGDAALRRAQAAAMETWAGVWAALEREAKRGGSG